MAEKIWPFVCGRIKEKMIKYSSLFDTISRWLISLDTSDNDIILTSVLWRVKQRY